MKKFSKIGKRVFALFLVALMNINTYATTTSNDGSSFITKAEFDTLINDFNNEMDKYQSGLNAKIDTAIANYISGASGSQQDILDNLDSQVKSYGDRYTKFWNYPSQGFITSNKNNYGRASAYYFNSQNNNSTYALFVRMHNQSYTSAGLNYVNFPDSANSLYLLTSKVGISDSGSGFDNGIACLYDPKPYINQLSLSVSYVNHSFVGSSAYSQSQLANLVNTSHTVNFNNKDKMAGIYSGVESTKVVNTVSCDGTLSETWTKSSASLIFNGAGCPSCNLISAQNLYCVDYNNRTVFDGDQVSINNVQGSQAGVKANCYRTGYQAYSSYEKAGGYTWQFKYYNHKIFTVSSVNLSNYGASIVTGMPIRLYAGVPLTKVSTLGKVIFSCMITNDAGNDTYLTISDEPFDNDDRYSTKTYTVDGNTYDHILFNSKLTSGKESEIEFDVKYLTDGEKRNGKILYYRLSQETSTDNTVGMSMVIKGDIKIKKEK